MTDNEKVGLTLRDSLIKLGEARKLAEAAQLEDADLLSLKEAEALFVRILDKYDPLWRSRLAKPFKESRRLKVTSKRRS